MITYLQFYRRFGVRKPEELLMFKQKPLRGALLPNRAIIHYIPNNLQELKVDLNDYFISSQTGLTYCIHQTELKSFIGAPIKNSVVAASLVRQLEKTQRSLRRVRQFETVNRDMRAALIVNYSPLQQLYRYRVSFLTSWQRWANVFATMIQTVAELSEQSDRHHYLRFDVPEFMPNIATLRMAARGITKMAVETLRTPEAFFLLELWKWSSNEPSLFDGLPKEHLDRFTLLVVDGDRFGAMNFGQLAEWRANESRIDENGEVKSSGSFYRRVLYFFIQFVKARVVDPKANELKEAPAETQQIQEELDQLSGDSETTASDEIMDADADAAQQEIDKLSKEIDSIDEQEAIDINDDTVFDTAPAKSTEEDQHLPKGSFDATSAPETGVLNKVEELTKSGLLSAAEQKRYTKLSEVYQRLPNPFGAGTVGDALAYEPAENKIDPVDTQLEDIEGVLDKTMLNNTLTSFDEDYITKVMQKDILRSLMAFQRDGTAIVDIKVTNVVDAVNKYQIITLKLQPVNGKPTTANIKVQVVKKDGTWVADGVQYRLRKQRRDYPISKTAPDEVALSTYIGKLFISRSSKVVHDFDRWLQNQVIMSAMDSNSQITEVSYRAHRNKAKLPPLPRLYTGLAKRFNAFTSNGYRVFLDYANRVGFFNEADLAVEQANPGLVLIAKGVAEDNRGVLLLVDDNGTIYINGERTLNVYGDISTLTGIDLSRAPLQQSILKLLGKNVPLGAVLCYYFGLEGAIERLGAKVRRVQRGSRIELEQDEYAIRFQDQVLVFSKQDRAAALLFAGFTAFSRQINCYPVVEYNKKDIYLNLFESIGLGVRHLRELDHLDRYFIDPMTLKILVDHNEPTDFVGLLLKANELLTTDYVEKKRRLLKGYERIPGAIYREVAQASRNYNSRPTSPRYGVDIKPTAIWQAIQQDPSISQVQNINPVHNLKEQEAVTESGTGGRSSRTMTAAHRSYDELDFGVISEATVDSSEVAVSTSTSASPNIVTLSGETRDYNKETDGIGTIMSTSANASPCALHDDRRVRLASNC